MKRSTRTTVFCILMAFSAAAQAGVTGYSINSDSGTSDADSLYSIDLTDGTQTLIGRVQSQGKTKIDVEGLAIAPDGTLYGVDDDSMTLFPIDTSNGTVINQQEVSIKGLPSGGGNDFGLTFACDGSLYATSVGTRSLYRIGLDGQTTLIGSLGPNMHISALAAYGNPVKLYGLGNGLTAAGTVDSPTLFDINPQTGAAAVKPQPLGGAVNSYNEAGLAFDDSGVLWAITDRRAVAGGPFPSQIITINTGTGVATHSAVTQETGFESLAISVPGGCSPGGGEIDDPVDLTIKKQWLSTNGDPMSGLYTGFMQLSCTHVHDGNGVVVGNTMIWEWEVKADTSLKTTVYPSFEGKTLCRVSEKVYESEIEVSNSCVNWFPVHNGDPDKTCTVNNLVFIEGIPTLGEMGKLLFAILMLATGLLAVRRH